MLENGRDEYFLIYQSIKNRNSVNLIALLAYHIDIQKQNTTKEKIKQKIKNSQTCSLFPMAK